MKKNDIISQLPGVFYRRPSPDEPDYVENGQDINQGDVIGLIEIMKTYQELESDISGKNITFKINEGDMVQPGQVIAEVTEI